MLARRTALPVIVGSERAQGIEQGFRDFGIDVAIFDDGYQVRNVHKDVELLVVNGRAPACGMRLFPLGFLREPLESARKADIILVNKGNLADPIVSLTVGVPVFRVSYRPLHLFNFKKRAMVDYRYAKGKKVLAFAGLGDNASFFELLREIGAEVVEAVEFPDHHDYRVEDMRRVQAAQNVELIVTTEKDAVKLDRMDIPERFFYLSVEARIEDEERLVDLVVKKMRR
jgi:tetraacyldisaccharide 4'-kinase